MPWTEKQTRYLLSKVSPLTPNQKNKMKGELHADPSLGHRQINALALRPKKRRAA